MTTVANLWGSNPCCNENPLHYEAESRAGAYIKVHPVRQQVRHNFWGVLMKVAIASTLILGSALAARAHLGTLTAPQAGQTYPVGSSVNIRWSVSVAHGTQDLAYSKANGPWVSIATGLGARVAAHEWVIPAAAEGGSIRLRICQRDGGGGCTDSHNTSSPGAAISLPGGGAVYPLISGNFTVSAPSSIRPGSAFDGASLAFRPGTRNVEAAFSLAAPERVTLEAFDTQGKRLAVLLDERKAEGRHVLSVFSHALNAGAPFMLRLQAGDRVLQQAMEAR